MSCFLWTVIQKAGSFYVNMRKDDFLNRNKYEPRTIAQELQEWEALLLTADASVQAADILAAVIQSVHKHVF